MGLGKSQDRICRCTIFVTWCKFGRIKLVHKSPWWAHDATLVLVWWHLGGFWVPWGADCDRHPPLASQCQHSTAQRGGSLLNPESKPQFCLWFVCCSDKELAFHPFKNSRLHVLNFTFLFSLLQAFFLLLFLLLLKNLTYDGNSCDLNVLKKEKNNTELD